MTVYENSLAERRSLAGEWEIEIGGQRGPVTVPGAWEVQGYPADVQKATYRRSVNIPAEWSGARIMLCFGAVSYDCTASVNGVEVGRNLGMWHPFDFDISEAVRYGELNEITLEVIKPGTRADEQHNYHDVLVGFIPYAAETFGGVWQDVWLTVHRAPVFPQLGIRNIDTQSGGVTVRIYVSSHVDVDARVVVIITDTLGRRVATAESKFAELEGNRYIIGKDIALVVPQPELWSPTSPTLYTLTVQLKEAERIVSETSRTFGFRALTAAGTRVLLNGEETYIRGILSWGWDPATLAPTPTDAQIRDEFRRVRALGFNMIKLCLFVPPPRVFEIADEEGMLLWLELPMWLPRLSDKFRSRVFQEYDEIVKHVHHHPSIVIYSLGCELDADMADALMLALLTHGVQDWISGVLFCDNSGSGEAYKGLDFDFADFNDYHFYADLHQFRPLLDHFRRDWRPARPLLFGEFCDGDDYRDPGRLKDDPTYTYWKYLYGIEGNPARWAFPEQAERMAALVLPFTGEQLVKISYGQSFAVRKFILEQVRARGEVGGYVLTGLRDTPINTSGMFDDFGAAKYDAERFTQFNAASVLLLEGGRTRAWVDGGDRIAPIDLHNHTAGAAVSHRVLYAGAAQGSGLLRWVVKDAEGRSIQEGTIDIGAQSAGAARQIARLEWTAPQVDHAQKLALHVEFGDLRNEWPLWVYPAPVPFPAFVAFYDPAGTLQALRGLPAHDLFDTARVLITSIYSQEIAAFVRRGGRALLLASGGPFTEAVSFWRESIKLIYDQMNELPHDRHADMQFYHLASDHAFDVRRFGADDVRPLLRRLDARLFTVLDYVVEMDIGAGRLLACALNICNGTGDQTRGLDANIAGRYLLDRMITHLQKE